MLTAAKQGRRILAFTVAGVLAAGPAARAADPQPYAVTIKPTGESVIDAAARDASDLVSLREKAPVGSFGLVARARSDIGRMTAVLESRGYYAGHVAISVAGRSLDDLQLPALLDAAPKDPPVAVEVTLVKGPLFRLGQVALRGDVPPRAAEILALPAGEPARAADVLAAHDRLLDGLRREGRALAKVGSPVATLHPDTQTLDIAFDVQAGPRVELGPISIAGEERLNESYIRRRLMLRPGQPYNPDDIEKARQDLAAVPALSSVRVQQPDALDTDGRLPLAVTVAERARHAVALGAAFSTDEGGSATATWTHRNLFGNAEILTLSAAATQLGGSASRQPGYNAGATLAFPDWFARSQTLSLNAQAIRESLDAYDRKALLASVKVDRKLTQQITLGGGVAFEVAQITQEDVKRTYKLVQLPLTAGYDTTDSVFDPTRGLRATLALTPTYSLSGGGARSATFFIAEASGSTYLDVGRYLGGRDGRSILAARALAGRISGAQDFAVPPDQRFYAGGGGTVRGYRFQSIGPAFADRKPAGGTSVEVGSVEWRQRFGSSYGAVAFIDAGSVGGGPSGLVGSGKLRVGAGAGFRYYTSFGPIRVDIAAPLNKDKQIKTDVVEAYIGIGQAF